MKKFLTISIFSLLVALTAPHAAFADTTSCLFDTDCGAGGKCDTSTGYCATGSTAGDTIGASCSDMNGNNGTMTSTGCVANTKDPSYVASPGASAAAAKMPGDPVKPDPNEGYNSAMQYIMMLFAWILAIAAITLDYTVYYTVIVMGDYVSKLSAVGTTWRILRDISNIALIFGFLAVGITTILKVDWYGGGKKMLPMLFLAAIFLNFSLFFAEAVIDVGNLFATQFYTQINGGVIPSAASLASTNTANEVISNKIMSQLGLQTLYGDTRKEKSELFNGTYPSLVGFMGILLFIVTAFVMFSLSFILIGRFITLIFLIILAPIGFAGLAVPMLRDRASQWWHALFAQTITAPILLLMLYVALAVITDVNFMTGFGTNSANTIGAWTSLAGTVPKVTHFAGVMLPFLVAMGLLMAITMQAKNMGAVGAALATKTAGKLTFGATAWGMQKTVGFGSHYAARAIRTSGIGGTRTGRVLANTFDKGAKASFDIRATKALSGLPGGGINAGEASKGGYDGAREANIKKHEAYATSIDEAYKERGPKAWNDRFNKDVKDEKKKLEEAKEAQRKAETAHNEAVAAYDEEKKKHDANHDALADEKKKAEDKEKQHKDKLDLLEEEEKTRIKFQTKNSPEEQRQLDTARQEHKASQETLAAVSGNLASAAKSLGDAQKAKEGTEKAKKTTEEVLKVVAQAPEERVKKEKNARKEAYASNIDTGFLENAPMWGVNLGLYGSGGSVAARKILASMKEKTDAQKIEDMMKKLGKAATEAETKAKTESAPKEEKPAEHAPTVA